MVTVLKHRLALAVLVGVLVIPVLSVNNGGLSHLLFCESAVQQNFAVGAPEGDGDAPVTSSTTLERDPELVEEEQQFAEVCDGVRASVTATPLADDRVELTVTIFNDSDRPWRGSVELIAHGDANDADLTAALGEVAPGGTKSASMNLRVLPGETEINGTLLLGP